MFGRLFGRKCELETSAVRLRDRTASSRITRRTIILIILTFYRTDKYSNEINYSFNQTIISD